MSSSGGQYIIHPVAPDDLRMFGTAFCVSSLKHLASFILMVSGLSNGPQRYFISCKFTPSKENSLLLDPYHDSICITALLTSAKRVQTDVLINSGKIRKQRTINSRWESANDSFFLTKPRVPLPHVNTYITPAICESTNR